MSAPIAFTGSHLDRAEHLRCDPAAMAALRQANARLLILNGLNARLSGTGNLQWGSLPDTDEELIFLGLDGNMACFVAVPPAPEPGSPPHVTPLDWQAMAQLPAYELASYGTARSLVSWHLRHRFCPNCGAATIIAKGGWQRTCSRETCFAEHFPRVDPVVIMLVEHDGRLLLGRQPRFPDGRFSTLAGFVEPGENIEEAVAREVFEEAGVRVRDVTYVASQPWPFPSSLMIGCHAVAENDALTIDHTELEDARWFARDAVSDAIEAVGRGDNGSAFGAPPAHAVAHVLMRWWLDHGAFPDRSE